MIKKAFTQMYPKRQFNYLEKLRYSSKFKDYNGNISLSQRGFSKILTVSLSREWEGVDEDIQIGIIQLLLNKLFKTSVKTLNIDLYHRFMKKVHLTIPKNSNTPILNESFDRINSIYLNNILEKPNLKWGNYSKRKLGTYEYGSDTITISTVLKDAPNELLDVVMYHEMLHKKHKFKAGARKSTYHTKEFKEEERRFKDFINTEKRLHDFLRYKRIKEPITLKKPKKSNNTLFQFLKFK